MPYRAAALFFALCLSVALWACGDESEAPPKDAAEAGEYERPDRPEAKSFARRRAQYLGDVRGEPVAEHRFRVLGDRIVFHSRTPDPGKHLWNHILAHLEANPSGRVKLPKKDTTVRNLAHWLFRYDNMFHFNADGPIACLLKFPDVVRPADRAYLYRGHPRSVLDHPEEPNYNLLTGEGTENHILMSRVSGYLYCREWLKDHPGDAEAKRRMEQARAYILRHARDVYHAGAGEFNTSTYYGYHMRGLLTCFDHAGDPEVRDACRALLDCYAAEICLKYVGGVNAGPESRGRATRSGAGDPDRLVWLWFGGSPLRPYRQSNLVYAALSSYRPPEVLRRIATKEAVRDAQYFNSHPTYLLDDPAHSRETLYFGPSYAMGCLYLPVAGLTAASSQFCPMKIVSRSSGGHSAWVLAGNSNTVTKKGLSRGPWDQWAQHRNVMIQLTHVPDSAYEMVSAASEITEQWARKWAASFRRRWGIEPGGNVVRSMDVKTGGVESFLLYPVGADYGGIERTTRKGVVFLRHDETYLAVRSVGGDGPRFTRKYGLTDKQLGKMGLEGYEWMIDPLGEAALAGFVIEAGSAAQHGSFEQFQDAVIARTRLERDRIESDLEVAYTNLAGERIVARYSTRAAERLIEPIFDWGYIADPRKDRPYPVPAKPPFQQPTYPAAGAGLEGWGRVPVVTVDGRPLGGPEFLDFSADWPVFRGPQVTLAGGVLTITDGQQTYRVDYSGRRPVWSE